MIELSRYVFETLREDQEFVLERGQGDGDLSAILVVAPVSEHPGALQRHFERIFRTDGEPEFLLKLRPKRFYAVVHTAKLSSRE